MNLHMKEFVDEIDELVTFMVSDTWEFYGTPNVNPDRIRKAFENNYYNSEGTKTFWISSDEYGRVGMLRIYDLDDGTPLFDIRINSKYKGKGIGTESIKWLVDYVFMNYREIDRIEANTRQDNYSMRCVFSKCNFVKEAHYRNGWECSNGDIYDSVGYGITRSDWSNKSSSPVIWNDFKC